MEKTLCGQDSMECRKCPFDSFTNYYSAIYLDCSVNYILIAMTIDSDKCMC